MRLTDILPAALPGAFAEAPVTPADPAFAALMQSGLPAAEAQPLMPPAEPPTEPESVDEGHEAEPDTADLTPQASAVPPWFAVLVPPPVSEQEGAGDLTSQVQVASGAAPHPATAAGVLGTVSPTPADVVASGTAISAPSTLQEMRPVTTFSGSEGSASTPSLPALSTAPPLPIAAAALVLSPRALAALAGDDPQDASLPATSPTVPSGAHTATGAVLAAIPWTMPTGPSGVSNLMMAAARDDTTSGDPDTLSDDGTGSGGALAMDGPASPGTSVSTAAGTGSAASVVEPPRLPMRPMAVALAARPGEQVELVLAPEELGRVRLLLHPSEGGVIVRISADRPETLALLRENAGDLAGELAAMGFGSAQFEFGGEARQDAPPPPSMEEDIRPTVMAAAPPAFRPTPSPVAAGGLDLRF